MSDIGFGSGRKEEQPSEDAYIEFPADKNHLISTGINSTLDSPIKILEEHIDNCKDAQATNVTVAISLSALRTGFIVEDDGRGIKHPDEVITFGSGHKEEEARQDPTVDYNGKFGEGAKSTLKIADCMDYYSNNGSEEDVFIRLRSPNKYPISEKKSIFKEKRPGGSCMPTVGTRVMAYHIDRSHLTSMIHEIADHTGRKFAWLLATKDFRVTVRITDENGRERPPFMLAVPPSLANLFEDYPDKKIAIGYVNDEFGREFQIEALMTEADKKSERRVYFACHRRIVKSLPTEYNVKVIVNCNGLQVTKDRNGFDAETPLAKIVQKKVFDYIARRFQKASLFENMTSKDKEAHYKVLDELNKFAEESGLLGRIMPQLKERHRGHAEVNPENLLMDQYLKTSRRTPPAEKVDDSVTLWQKVKAEKTEEETEEEIEGGEAPGPTGEKGGKAIVDPKVRKRELLVQKVVEDKDNKRKRTHYAINAQVEQIGRNKSIRPGFFSIATTEDDESIAVSTSRAEQSGTIYLNLNHNFFKLNRPPTYPHPEYSLREIIPLLAEGATDILYGIQIAQPEYRKKYDHILHRLSGVFLVGVSV